MANQFKSKALTLTDTNEVSLLTVTGSSVYIIGSIIVTNRTAGTDSTIDMRMYDDSESLHVYLLNAEPINRTISREILARPVVLELGDSLKLQAASGNVYDVYVSYLDRNRS